MLWPAWRSREKGNLGWVPLNAATAFKIDEDHGAVILLGRLYRRWFSRPLDGKIKTAAFREDARGRWYFNVQLQVAGAPAKDGPSGGG
jgi:putative transposase